ncbi:MAG: hypothetical protein QHH09_02230 [Microgenomates group bacterium]|nr:hypothetical protein [Microgenomates group bacterium]
MIKNLFRQLTNSFLKIEKRFRFVISTLLLTFLMLFSTFFFFEKAWLFIPIFIIASYLLTYFSILEGIEKIEWLMLFIMPVVFSVSFYLFYFLFPVRWLTRLPFTLIFAVSVYALFLVSNIFNVGVEKSLQLYRAAFSVNYFYQTLIVFLIGNLLFASRLGVFLNGFITFLIAFILANQLLWSITLNLRLEKKYYLHALFIGLILMEEVVVLSFVPFQSSILALILTASYYSLGGLTYSFLDQRLFKETVREYLIVLGFILIIGLLSLGW